MSLVVILNNGSDIVIATDKRIIYTDVNDVVTRIDDNCRKMFFCVAISDTLCYTVG